MANKTTLRKTVKTATCARCGKVVEYRTLSPSLSLWLHHDTMKFTCADGKGDCNTLNSSYKLS